MNLTYDNMFKVLKTTELSAKVLIKFLLFAEFVKESKHYNDERLYICTPLQYYFMSSTLLERLYIFLKLRFDLGFDC